jgi:serine/threonine protein kinase
MSEPPITGEWPATDPAASEASVHWPTIPGYEILQELGRGGMGVVYKARQTNSNRLVALKLIRDGALAGPQERGRFRIEAEAAARMRHANIIQIYDVGEHAGRLYFAMEFVEGGSLDQHLTGGPLPPTQAAELLRTLALAVEHAHTQKVVHRDLKPANILLCDESKVVSDESKPATGTVHSLLMTHSSSLIPKITDFSLAKRLDSHSTAWTRDGDVLGTASYMAPEQAAGRVSEIGAAADVYALGAILYELLTGRPPFLANSWNETIQQVLLDEPAPLWQLRPGVPRDLETVCLKCLEKESSRRYASAMELAADLERFLQGRPVTAVPLGARERLVRLAGRYGYQVVGEIGRGSRSTVYHALSGPLRQPVALKVFVPGICTREEWEARFRRAVEARAPLSHPSIVPIHGAGWWDNAPYLALEYVPQGSLASKPGQPFPIAQAIRMLQQLTEIVGYLHRQGVIHGNLKPGNILLAADGIPRVVDFHSTGGLFQGSLPADDQEPTGLGYLAPEQVRDPTAELRPYTDIYGLGMIFYELLTGQPPFAAPTAREMLEQVRFQDPVPPSRLNPKVTPDLECFCLTCLRKNPWRRYHRTYTVLKRLVYFQEELRDDPVR